MIFLILALSCTFKELRVKEKGKREDISRAIQNPEFRESKAIIEKINKTEALIENEAGHLPIEEAIELGNIEVVDILLKIKECDYPEKVYWQMLNTRDVGMFNLIPQIYLNYRILLKIKEMGCRDIEEEFMNRIESTELERLIIEGKVVEIKEKSKKWLMEHYIYERGSTNRRRINTTEILCVYGSEAVETVLSNYKKDMKKYALSIGSKIGNKEVVKWLLDNGVDANEKLEKSGRRPLMLAAENGHKDVCELLL